MSVHADAFEHLASRLELIRRSDGRLHHHHLAHGVLQFCVDKKSRTHISHDLTVNELSRSIFLNLAFEWGYLSLTHCFSVSSKNRPVTMCHILPKTRLHFYCRQYGTNFIHFDVIGPQSCRIRWKNVQ